MAQDLVSQPPLPAVVTDLSDEDRDALKRAVIALERPSLVARLANIVGRPLEVLGHTLPAPVRDAISSAAEAALRASLRVALTTLRKEGSPSPRAFHDGQ